MPRHARSHHSSSLGENSKSSAWFAFAQRTSMQHLGCSGSLPVTSIAGVTLLRRSKHVGFSLCDFCRVFLGDRAQNIRAARGRQMPIPLAAVIFHFVPLIAVVVF